MNFSGKVGNGPMNKKLNFGGNSDLCRDTGETWLGRGTHCPSASSSTAVFDSNKTQLLQRDGVTLKGSVRTTRVHGCHFWTSMFTGLLIISHDIPGILQVDNNNDVTINNRPLTRGAWYTLPHIHGPCSRMIKQTIQGTSDKHKTVIANAVKLSGSLVYKSSAVAEMGDHLVTTDMGQKVGGLLCPFPWESWVPI